MDYSIFCLFINIIIWAITLYEYYRRRKVVDSGFVVIGSFFVYSLLSFLLFIDDFYGAEYHSITLFPFVYLYLMVLLSASPIFKYTKPGVVEKIATPNMLIFNMISILIIICTIICIPNSIAKFSTGIMRLLADSAAGLDIYRETMDEIQASHLGDGSISNLPSIITNIFSDICCLMFFYYMTLKKRNRFISIGLLIAVIFPIIQNISIAQRGPVVTRFFAIVISFFAVIKFLPHEVKRITKIAGIVLLILITIPMVAITISRFDRESEGGALQSVYYYSGQQNLNFNMYGLDNGGIRYGDRTFPLFKRMLGFENVPKNFYERRMKYQNLKINDEVFIGYVGDFTLDFGPYVAPFFFILFTLIIVAATKETNKTIMFHQLMLVHFVMCVCFQGGIKLFSYADNTGNLKIIVLVLVYLVFYFTSPVKTKPKMAVSI